MDKRIIIGLILILIGSSLMTISFLNTEYKTKTYDCVDGKGGVNLEGLRCEKEIEYIFGLESSNLIIIFLFLLMGCLFFFGSICIYAGVFLKWEEEDAI